MLQVVTLVTPDGSYGGPLRVALNQVSALRGLGHDVTLVAGAAGYSSDLPTVLDGVQVSLFPSRRLVPGLGFAGISSPGMLRWLGAHSREFDVIHIHFARDLTAVPAALMAIRRGTPIVLQTHGMVDPSSRRLARALDRLATRRILRRASTVLSLTDVEDDALRSVGGRNLPIARLVNGVPSHSENSAEPEALTALYLARLHRRKRPEVFVEAALRLLDEFPHASFELVGPDEGAAAVVLARLQEAGSPTAISVHDGLAPSAVLDRMRGCAVYALPSVDEPFPMTVLEAMSLGKPVIVTDTCGLAEAIAHAGAGIVVDARVDSLIEALRRLLLDKSLRLGMGARGRALVNSAFSMQGVSESLIATYTLAARSV